MSRFPGPKSQELIRELSRYVVVEPYPFVLDLPRCRGMWLVTVDGERIFDWAGYYGAKLLGHNHPRLLEPEYAARLVHAANNKVANPDFLTPECLAYYRLLHELAPRCMRNDRLEVYVVNSGAEAVENMMKYMINLHAEKLRARGESPDVRRFVYFESAFHGRTIFALNVTQLKHDPIVTAGFQGFVPGNLQVPFPHFDSSRREADNVAECDASLAIVEDCLARYGREVVGIVVEPIQGAGGHRTSLPRFFQGLSALAHRFEVPLGFDEVQTAGGQTGTVFAIDQLDLPHPPTAVAVAKKFGNGVVYMHHSMADHGVLDSTWGGTLADMVRFVEEMRIVRSEELIEQVPRKAEALTRGLADLERRYADFVFNVRGMGLYQGFSLRRPGDKARLLDLALEREGLLLLGAGGQSIRFRPPLDVTAGDIELMLEMLGRCLGALADAPAARAIEGSPS
ncbi:MAG TPA: aminotransferase class III-fold pyridoxal phosphate-dependent enzyme [Anaeromyxobacter sp.]|nr:aminotransferase class III-fold pyridoxal phosphate-dependent enzyme [Anaeromyxobacter sp.]